jgi:FixJ family two-component response regulator
VSGLEFQTHLAGLYREIPIVFVTGHGDIPMTVQAMKAGAVDFLTKPFRDQDMLDAVATALARDRARRRALQEVEAVQARFGRLTTREREVMTHVTAGLLNKQIAAEMGLSEKKTAARSVANLVRMAEALRTRSPAEPR